MSEFTRPRTEKDLRHNFAQIKPAMNATMAYYESSRCLFCYDAPCVQACPTGIDIPLFIRQIHSGNTYGAARTIYSANYLGFACGQVCPTEVLCEGACVYNHQDVKPIEIGRLQSYASGSVLRDNATIFSRGKANGRKIAVIGAGPAGISCACELSSLGYQVEIFEAKALPSGLTLHGVAPYKITNDQVLDEILFLQRQFGFRLHLETPIMKKKDYRKLEKEFEAIFLGIGLGSTRPVKIPGEDLRNSWGAVEFIERVKLEPLNTIVGKRVVVVGGGNTAMDAASEASRLGAEKVFLVYRRSREEMPAYTFEYELAKSVGVKGLFNLSPLRIKGKKKVRAIEFARTETSGGAVRILKDDRTRIECDLVIRATGQNKLKFLKKAVPGINFKKNGTIAVDPHTYRTSHPHYFAAGDAVNGGKEVVNAVAEGKLAARGIHAALELKTLDHA
jgi:dihydropyrimidine dehydrogenase (NAD+) subunit PreT